MPSQVHPQAALERLIGLVLDSVTSPESKRAYRRALADFLSCSQPGAGFSKATVQAYRAHLEARGLSPATINLRLAAVRKLAAEASDNGLLAPELAAGIARAGGARRAGLRIGNWLSHDQAERLINAPETETLKGARDRALLALLVGCGLRRKEIAELTLEHLAQRESRWVIVDLVGKGGRIRTIPMPSWAKVAIDRWVDAAGITGGRVFRAINKGDRICRQGMSPQAVFDTVRYYARHVGIPIRPHDLRRTFARLAHKGRAALEQIQLSLGHSSIQTTERYLGVKQDLTDAPCDHLGLRVATLTDGEEPA